MLLAIKELRHLLAAGLGVEAVQCYDYHITVFERIEVRECHIRHLCRQWYCGVIVSKVKWEQMGASCSNSKCYSSHVRDSYTHRNFFRGMTTGWDILYTSVTQISGQLIRLVWNHEDLRVARGGYESTKICSKVPTFTRALISVTIQKTDFWFDHGGSIGTDYSFTAAGHCK